MKNIQTKKRTGLTLALLMLGTTSTVVTAQSNDDGINRVEVTQKQVQQMAIKVTKAEKGNVPNIIPASGEIQLDANRMAYVPLQIPGIVKQIHANLGQNVDAGEVLVVINRLKLATAKSDDETAYPILSPLQGTVLQKHVVQGEVLRESENLFMIADLSKVWVNLAISQDKISRVKIGYPVKIRLPDGVEAEGKIDYISPLVDSKTRNASARITLDNRDGNFRPGSFVEAMIQVPSTQQAVVVPKDAVQLVFDSPTVFVWVQGVFEQREVTTGISDGTNVEILRGVVEGELVASENAFHLKAQVIKAAAGDAVRGHGHAH